jgi:outer membrane protein
MNRPPPGVFTVLFGYIKAAVNAQENTVKFDDSFGNQRILARWGQRLFFGIVLLAAMCQPVGAAGLMEIYRQAQENDPLLQSAYSRTRIAEEGQRQARAGLFPTVTASASLTETKQDIVSSDNEVFGSGKTNYASTIYGVTLTQPVFRWDSIVGWKQSKVFRMQAAAEAAVVEQELILRVAELYFRALAAKDQLDYILAEEASVSRHYELAQGRLDMGLIPITDLHDARARLAATRAQTIAAQNQLDDALQAISEVTGQPVSELQVLRADISLTTPEPFDLERWLSGAMEQNPGIELRRKAVEAAQLEVRQQKAGHYPALDLVGTYEDKDTEGSLFGGGSQVETFEVGLQLSLPLYQGGAVSSRVRAAHQELLIAQQDLTRQSRAVLRETRSAFLGANSALSRVDALQQSVVSNQLALDAKQEGFMSGLFTSLNVLDAERDLSLVSIDYAQARYDYILNSLRLKQSVGSLNGQDLLELERLLAQ